jgi:carbonic anhydrase/acetyltransferase-like protein (isoleucine patch superfamily)
VPDGSVVMGAPGKIRGELDEARKQALIDSATHYVENAKRFKSGLKALY